ncbi:hypothetical protein EJB05_22326, partial [Eragrostis curvula]
MKRGTMRNCEQRFPHSFRLAPSLSSFSLYLSSSRIHSSGAREGSSGPNLHGAAAESGGTGPDGHCAAGCGNDGGGRGGRCVWLARQMRPGRVRREPSMVASREMRRQVGTCCSLSGVSKSSPRSLRRRCLPHQFRQNPPSLGGEQLGVKAVMLVLFAETKLVS